METPSWSCHHDHHKVETNDASSRQKSQQRSLSEENITTTWSHDNKLSFKAKPFLFLFVAEKEDSKQNIMAKRSWLTHSCMNERFCRDFAVSGILHKMFPKSLDEAQTHLRQVIKRTVKKSTWKRASKEVLTVRGNSICLHRLTSLILSSVTS